jgi:GcrA cell cycle regulator
MAWTNQRVEELKNLWSEGLSASQIAKRLGDVTRNAVIGKVHRLGLEARAKPAKKQVSVGQLDSNLISVSYSGNLAFKDISSDNVGYSSKADLAEPKLNNLHSVTEQEYVSILNLTENNCKWPIGDPSDEDFHFCGHQPYAGMPYCETHAKKAYKKLKASIKFSS